MHLYPFSRSPTAMVLIQQSPYEFLALAISLLSLRRVAVGLVIGGEEKPLLICEV